MSEGLLHLVCIAAGVFIIVSATSSMFYGWFPIVVCVIGLILLGAVFR